MSLMSLAPRFRHALGPIALTGLTALGCGSPQSADTAPRPEPEAAASVASTPAATSVAATAGSAATADHVTPPAEPSDVPATEVTMHPVVEIEGLFGLLDTPHGVYAQVGQSLGSGTMDHYRLVPIRPAGPDFAAETQELTHLSTGYYDISVHELDGDLLKHDLGVFRGGFAESYSVQDDDGDWSTLAVNDAGEFGVGLYPWSDGRLLEFRTLPIGYALVQADVAIPSFRVLGGKDQRAPTIPAALRRKLTDEGFVLSTFKAFADGSVIAVGLLSQGRGAYGTLWWKSALAQPFYFHTDAMVIMRDGLRILGGSTLADVRLLVEDEVMKLETDEWVVESKLSEDGFPDVWFGRPSIFTNASDEDRARMRAGGPWLPIQRHNKNRDLYRSLAVDPHGTLWMVEDEVLYASARPDAQLPKVTAATLIADRKRSILRGGEHDTLPERFQGQASPCSRYYVRLHSQAAAGDPNDDYAAVRRHLRGRALTDPRFIVTVEGDRQFFGVSLASEDEAKQLAKSLNGKPGLKVAVMCADPPATRELRIDLKTGEISP